MIKLVEVTLPKSELIPEGVVLVDIPGTGDFNSKRDEMWKKVILFHRASFPLSPSPPFSVKQQRMFHFPLNGFYGLDRVKFSHVLSFRAMVGYWWQETSGREESRDRPGSWNWNCGT